MNEEARCVMLAREHDATSRSLQAEAQLARTDFLRDQIKLASKVLQQLANAYAITAKEVRDSDAN